MLPPVFLFLFGCFIQFVSAGSLFGLLQPHGLIRTSNSRVYGRQTPAPTMQTVPTQCKSSCDPVISVLNMTTPAQGCSPADCCQESFVKNYFNCLKCAGAAENITDFKSAQLVLDELTASCDAKGLPVPKQTLPGIDPNRPLPPLPLPSGAQPQTLSGIDPNRPLPSPQSLPSGTLPPSATNQQTVTGLPTSVPPLSASVTAPPVTTTSSTSSAVSTRFLSPHFSHLLICAISLVVFAQFLE